MDRKEYFKKKRILLDQLEALQKQLDELKNNYKLSHSKFQVGDIVEVDGEQGKIVDVIIRDYFTDVEPRYEYKWTKKTKTGKFSKSVTTIRVNLRDIKLIEKDKD